MIGQRIEDDQADQACQRLTLSEYMMACANQGVKRPEDVAVVCPSCGTVQSTRDFIAAGVAKDPQEVEMYVGTACIGRFNGASRTPTGQVEGKGCGWMVGGMLQIHTLEVVTPDGNVYPRFALATPEQARAHEGEMAKKATSL